MERFGVHEEETLPNRAKRDKLAIFQIYTYVLRSRT